MSFIKRNRPGRGWRITAGTLLPFCSRSSMLPRSKVVHARESRGGPPFDLPAGTPLRSRTSARGDVIDWQVDREETT
jgi:hypothetical protein